MTMPDDHKYVTLMPEHVDCELLRLDQQAKKDGFIPETRRLHLRDDLNMTVVEIYYERRVLSWDGVLTSIDIRPPGEPTAQEVMRWIVKDSRTRPTWLQQ